MYFHGPWTLQHTEIEAWDLECFGPSTIWIVLPALLMVCCGGRNEDLPNGKVGPFEEDIWVVCCPEEMCSSISSNGKTIIPADIHM